MAFIENTQDARTWSHPNPQRDRSSSDPRVIRRRRGGLLSPVSSRTLMPRWPDVVTGASLSRDRVDAGCSELEQATRCERPPHPEIRVLGALGQSFDLTKGRCRLRR